MSDPDCLFCKIVAGEIPATRVREDERTVAFMDINPATRGHVLVDPARPRPRPAGRSPRGGPRRLRRGGAGPGRAARATGSARTA